MRALLLLVLGAGLVWFVWRGFGPGSAAEGESQAAAPGSMIAVDPPPEASAEPQAAHEPAKAVPTAPAATPTAPAAPVSSEKVPESAPAAASIATDTIPVGAGAIAGSPAEIAAAEALLRDPAGLGAWLATRGVDLPAGRREYATALAHAFAGQAAEARAALDRAAQGGELAAGERALALEIADRREVETIASSSPLARAASMRDREGAAMQHLARGSAREAAECFSLVLLAEIASPWRADAERLGRWSDRLREAQAAHRWNRRSSWRSSEIVVQPGDSLISVRKRAVAADPSLIVCTGQIARANQLSGEVIHPGAKLRIPLDPVRVLVDVDAHWAFYIAGEEVVAAWPVGVGKESSVTRLGTFTAGKKTKEPMWFPQGRAPVPYGDPENPLGTRWIAWDDAAGQPTGLGFHGTNEPDSIGRDASLGCIRMRTPDVEELYEVLPVGARIQVVP